MSDRDKTLINILERMADQIQKQGFLLEEILQNQSGFEKAVENAVFHRDTLKDETDKSLEKISDSISRYRSDMMNLVHEQDSISKSLKEFNKLVNKTTYSLETTSQMLVDIDGRVKSQERTVSEHYEHALKQAEKIPKEIADSGRRLSNLHADTEKHLGEQHRETQRQLEKLQHETTRRLLALEDIDSALKTLLVRTEPPEKKPIWIIRPFKRIGAFFRIKLPSLFKGIRARPVK